jgi:Neuraminidase-like domain
VLGLVCAVAARSLADPAGWPKMMLTAAKDDRDLAGFLRWVSRWLMLRDRLHLDAATLQAIAKRPDAFGLDLRTGKLPFRRIAELGRLQAFVQSCHDRNGSIVAATVALVAPPVALAVRDRLADATGWPTDQIPVLLAEKWWPNTENAATQILRLADCFGLLRRLGADASFAERLMKLADETASANWDDFKQVANLTIAKVGSLYEQGQWRAIYDQLHGRFETRRRDVLLALELDALKRLRELHPDQYPDFSTTRDVYQLLLIEVEMGPETQISYIKEGLNALQLYLQRARMRLESAVVQLDIPEAWWDWIMRIQTWQANRKIFLYPENYLLPSLRQDKTTLFKTLETDLRQQEVAPAYVETVSKTYLEGFAGLAKLKPIDAFRTRVADPRRGKIDATYLVARDDTDPYSFFICCQQDGYPWGEWEKIDLAIHSKYVTLAYAFDRLFVFWIVVKKTTGSAIEVVAGGGSKSTKSASYTVTVQYALFTGGLDSLLDLKTQQIPVAPVMPFDRLKPSSTNLEFPKALDVAQVDFDGLYGRYYWEIFFHIPALVADSLAVNQRFQDARGWLHYIFNPTLTEQFVTDDVIVTETDGFIQKALAGSIVTSLKTSKVIDIGKPVKATALDDHGRVHAKFTPELGLDFLKQLSVTDDMILRVRNILLNYQLSSGRVLEVSSVPQSEHRNPAGCPVRRPRHRGLSWQPVRPLCDRQPAHRRLREGGGDAVYRRPG